MKIYILLIVVFLMAGNLCKSQSLQILDKATGAVISGTTVTLYGAPDAETSAAFNVKNNSGASLNVKVRRIYISLISGSTSVLCWGISCYPPYVSVSGSAQPIAAGATDTSFIAHFNPHDSIGTSTVIYSFFNTSNPADSVYITVKYNIAINNVPTVPANSNYISNPYPSPANSFVSFNYMLKNNSKGVIAIYNILGEVVKQFEIYNSGTAKISTYELKQGIYIYTVRVDDKVVKTSRLMITH
ncbi:MAG: T9SS type A sorting domain-containing protein [Bacteroidia bacterium]|nr:T9SS type A sorting domain-containing protein [Bacteroidia bacterium]